MDEQTLQSRRVKLSLRFAEACLKDTKFRDWFKIGVSTRSGIIYQEPEAKTGRYRNSAIPYLTRLLNSKISYPYAGNELIVSCWIMSDTLKKTFAFVLVLVCLFYDCTSTTCFLFNKPYYYYLLSSIEVVFHSYRLPLRLSFHFKPTSQRLSRHI